MSVKYSTYFYLKMFLNYDNEIGQGLRNILFLNSLVNGFTLSPNVRDKKLLTAWYVNNFITPVMALVEKFLLKNPVFTTRALRPDYDKEIAVYRDQIITIREPEFETGELGKHEKTRRVLKIIENSTPIRKEDLIIREPKKRKQRTKTEKLTKDPSEKAAEKERKRREKEIEEQFKETTMPFLLDETEMLVLKTDLIRYLSSDLVGKGEKDFLESFLQEKRELKPMQPQNLKYETWRRQREYNLPRIRLKREVFQEKGLKFPRYSPEKTPIERKLGL